MSNHDFTLTPRDVLFMHDARPMEASDAGQGANWPRPDQLWNAVINMFHRQWPERQEWEGDRHTCNAHDKNADSSFRFGALQTVGPFPLKEENGKTTLFLPCPLDLSADDDESKLKLLPMKLVSADRTDMPKPLKYAFQAPVLGKQKLPQWLSLEDYGRYLAREEIHSPLQEKFFTVDRNIGIEIDSDTSATVDGKLYQAEYLRLMSGVSMAFSASCDIKAKHRKGAMTDVFKELGVPKDAVIGGQQGVARLDDLKGGLNLPCVKPDSDCLKVRWTLLSPLVSTGGWLPSWICAEDGKVMLRVKTEREPNESREKWRERLATSPVIHARLIAARIGKPIAFSGWDLQAGPKESAGAPKKTMLAVPAGSCYVFECDSEEDVKNLWKALDGKRLSSVYGEKGFGIGVCSSYK